MKISRYFFLLTFLLIIVGCGVSENALPVSVEENNYSVNYGLTVLQTNKEKPLGEEFIPVPSLKTAWGIGGGMEISMKTFGLGLGAEFKKELFKNNLFAVSVGGEGDFSFPMLGYMETVGMNLLGLSINQDFINYVAKPIYFAGGRVNTGFFIDTVAICFFFKGGVIGNAGFLPDLGATFESGFVKRNPDLAFQATAALLFRETPTSFITLGFEFGYIYPLNLIYLSGTYSY